MASTESRQDNIYFARLSEQGESYEDMINYMKKVAEVSINLIKTLASNLLLTHHIYFIESRKTWKR